MRLQGEVAAILVLGCSFVTGCTGTYERAVSVDTAKYADLAKAQPAAQWRIPLGTDIVERMEWIGPDLLLVSLKIPDAELSSSDLLLVDASKGQVLWRHPRQKTLQYSLSVATATRIALVARSAAAATLVVLDGGTGQAAWQTPAKLQVIAAYPAPDNKHVLVRFNDGKTPRLAAFRLADGVETWNREMTVAGSRMAPVVASEDLLLFNAGVERLNAASGKTVWQRPELPMDPANPQPQLVDGLLYFISNGRLIALDARNGSTSLDTKLSGDVGYSSIFPFGRYLYLRGVAETDQPFVLEAVRRTGGGILWRYADTEPTVSNIVEVDGKLYVATSNKIICLDADNGARYFANHVQDASTLYPVHLKRTESGIVYVGELVVAGYELNTGKKMFWHGVTPLSPGETLDGLAVNIKRYQEKLDGKNAKESTNRMSGLYAWQVRTYQEQGNQYQRAFESSWSDVGRLTREGKYNDANMAFIQAKGAALQRESARRAERTATVNQLTASLKEAGEMLAKAMEQAADTATLNWMAFVNESIVAGFVQAENEQSVYRPHGDGSAAAIAIVDTRTGAKRVSPLSIQYKGYGLWNLYEPEKKRVIYQGIGLDPATLEFGEPIDSGLAGRERRYKSYLIAQPINPPS